MQSIFTAAAPKPGGHYSQAVEHNGLIYVSGQLPIDAKTGAVQPGTIEEQCTLILKNIRAILEAADSGLAHILKCTIYIADVSLWPRVNAVYAEYLGDHRPARVIVPVGPLHYGALVEMDCVAAVKSTTDEYFYFSSNKISNKNK